MWKAVIIFVLLSFKYCFCLRNHILGLPKTQCVRIQIPECFGLGYNETYMPNLFHHSDQIIAQDAMRPFQVLLDLECSPDLRFFLCSLFVPMCSELVSEPIPACRSHCMQVRRDCEPALNRLQMKWPADLECIKFPGPPKICMLRPNDEDSQMAPHLPQSNVEHGEQSEHLSTSYDCYRLMSDSNEIQKEFVDKWSTGWGFICLITTLFTLLTWTVEPTRYRYPERPILFVALCYWIYSLIYVLKGLFGITDYANSCLITAVCLYYSNLAGAAWWTAFVLSWWLSAARDWSTEALSNVISIRLHVVCWGGPFIVTSVVFWRYVTSINIYCDFQRPFTILIPHIILLVATCILSALACQALIQVRKTLRLSGRSTKKLERLMTRLSVYILFYIVFTIGWLFVTALSLQLCDTRHLEILKIFLSLLIGILSSMWVCSTKTFRAWRKLLCNTPPEKIRSIPVSRV